MSVWAATWQAWVSRPCVPLWGVIGLDLAGRLAASSPQHAAPPEPLDGTVTCVLIVAIPFSQHQPCIALKVCSALGPCSCSLYISLLPVPHEWENELHRTCQVLELATLAHVSGPVTSMIYLVPVLALGLFFFLVFLRLDQVLEAPGSV